MYCTVDIHVGPPESKNPFRKMCAEWKHIANNWILLWKHMHIPWDWNLKQAIFNGNCWVFIFRSIFFKFISWHHMVSVIASNRFSVRCPSILCFAQSDFILAIWSIKNVLYFICISHWIILIGRSEMLAFHSVWLIGMGNRIIGINWITF